MLQLNLKTFLSSIIITGILASLATSYLTEPKIEYKEKVITKTQEKVRVLTKTIERPDGTKITTTDTRKDTDSSVVAQKESKPVVKDWLIGATVGSNVFKGATPTYGITVSRRLILGLYGGVYVRTDKEVGLTLTYSF